ncbi:hypothetical protein [Prevotella sp.]|uniref:hypothetical protein n=1 Tax=Prevotella sp. TaxID=59823 RepID=UPI0030810B33
MKKILVISLSAAVLMSGCGAGNDNTAAGGFMGAQLGSILGSAIGGISGGPRGSDIGTIVGMAGGAMVGAVVGNAADKADQRRYEEYKSQRRSQGSYDNTSDYSGCRSDENNDSGFDPANGGDDIIDFGDNTAPMSSDNGGTLNISESSSMHIDGLERNTPMIELRNVRFINEAGNLTLRRGEIAKIVVEVYNRTSDYIYGVQPQVVETTGNKHVFVSSPILVEKIAPGRGIRYTAMVKADRRIKDGEISFAVSAKENANQNSSETKTITVRTIK